MNIPSGFILPVLAISLAAPSLRAQSEPAPSPAPTVSATDTPVPAETRPGSEIRIVRLSQTKGDVQLDRNTDRGFEPAFTNLPIIQSARLRTAEGIAEVEFEDNSSLRLTPNTLVDFPQLRLQTSGATLSTVHLLQGTIYISLEKTRGNEFTVTLGKQQLTLTPGSHIELTAGSPSKLSVFEGAVDVQRSTGTLTVGKKKELLFDAAGESAPTLLTKVEKTPFDEWDKNSASYHRNYASSAFGGNTFGSSDLNYYGSFVSLPGCGSVWQPYFASASWSPFANGLWAWYPGAGYSWVSPYPWGWMPFHSGSWQQCGGAGWGWQPGGSFTGLGNASKINKGVTAPIHPPHPPTTGRPTLVPVNTRPLAVSGAATSELFVLRKDSAGLGIPRDTFGSLKSASNDVARHGSSTTPISSEPGLVTLRPGAPSSASAGMAAGSTHYTHITAAAPSSTSSPALANSYGASHSVSGPTNSAPSVHTSSPSPSAGSTGSSRK